MVQYLYAVMQSLTAREDEGQGLVEYALIIALVSIALVVGLGALTGGIGTAFSKITTELTSAA